MFEKLVVFHRRQNQLTPHCTANTSSALWQGEALVFVTCLRELVVSCRPEAQDFRARREQGYEILFGIEAYKFCLEVICGLHSPMLGETEVFGQFRQLCKQTNFGDLAAGDDLRRVAQGWLTDAKLLRENFLAGLGSQSYGSLVRRMLRGCREVSVLGTGHLASQIIPWLAKDFTLQVVGRSASALSALTQQFSFARFSTVSLAEWRLEGPACDRRALVVAAPVSAQELSQILANSIKMPSSFQTNIFSLAVDLRGEGERDPLSSEHFGRLVSLGEVFGQIQQTRSDVLAKVAEVRAEISRRAHDKLTQAKHRPFGWDDLCA